MENRKVIQLTISAPNVNDPDRVFPILFALCDDGTIWWSNVSNESENWQLYKQVPTS
jgi:hypothetical protein